MKRPLLNAAATTLSAVAALMAVECVAAGYGIRFDREDVISSFNFTAGRSEPKGADLSGKDHPDGELLRLRGSEHKKIDEIKLLNMANGSISLWIRPLWDGHDDESHVILSMRWNDGRNGYMALSWGWWEAAGARKLYFVLNNQDHLACSTDSGLDLGDWNMITVVWNSAGCKLFVDGQKLADRLLEHKGRYFASGPMFLGSDRGSTEVRGRRSDFEMDSLLILSRPLSEKEVFTLYQERMHGFSGLESRKQQWLDFDSPVSSEPTRTIEGIRVENRVIFEESAEWAMSELAADRLLNRIQRAGFNVLVPCVWHGRGTHYPSPLTEMDPRVKGAWRKDRDALAALISKAHRMGIEVHPWFTVVRREDDSMQRYFGKGVPDGAYDVHDEQFRTYIVNVMLDVVRRYDIDGINLDYIRAMGLCESDRCKQDYAGKTGHDLMADHAKATPGSAERSRIQSWQDEAVLDIVSKLAREARKVKPNLIISVDGNPEPGDRRRDLEGRDELSWTEKGLVDVVFNMDYRLKPDIGRIAAVRQKIGRNGTFIQIFGNYDRRDHQTIPRAGRIVSDYARYAQTHWGQDGIAYYIAQALSDEQIAALAAGPFKDPAITSWSFRRRSMH
jgi:hypothetical protein